MRTSFLDHLSKDLLDGSAIFQRLLTGSERLNSLFDGSFLLRGILADAAHALDVARLNFSIARHLGFQEESLRALYLGGILHDVGKGIIPQYILNKESSLSSNDRFFVQLHPVVSFLLVTREFGSSYKSELLNIVAECCLFHHERLDGSGYPVGLKGRAISLYARITAVSDVYAALLSDRSYRKGYSVSEALDILEEEARQGKLDSEIVALLREVSNFEPLKGKTAQERKESEIGKSRPVSNNDQRANLS